jgi:hypothetical protein
MKTFIRTIIVFVAFNLITAGFAFAQNASEEEALAAQRQVEIARKEAELAVKAAQKEAEIAQKQMEAAQKQVEESIRQVAVAKQSIPALEPTSPVPPTMPRLTPEETRLSNLRRRLSSRSQSGSAGTVFVIPSAEIEVENLLMINEDMNVMSRIFENNLHGARIALMRANLFLSSHDPLSVLLARGRGAIQGMYLQGYGALFLMKVDFPLSAPPQTPEEKGTEKEEKGDKVWEQMRREMYEPERVAKRKTDDKEPEYDPEKVENLKTALIKALKHAANIRNLKPDESVVLTIIGSGEFAGEAIITTRRRTVVDGHNRVVIQEPESEATRLSLPTVLAIRATKSDINMFANGELDFEQFRQRVQMLSYPLLGGAVISGDSLDFYHKYKSVPTR